MRRHYDLDPKLFPGTAYARIEEFLNSENTEGTSDASHKSGSYKTVRECNATRANTTSDAKASVDGPLEKITDTERAECRNPHGCACKEANGYPLTDCSYWW